MIEIYPPNFLFCWFKGRATYNQNKFHFITCRVNCIIFSYSSRSTRETTQFYSPSQTTDGRWIWKQTHEQRLSDKLDSGGTLPRSRASVWPSNSRNAVSHTTRNRYVALLFNAWRHLRVRSAATVYLCEMGAKYPFICESPVPRSSDLVGGRLEGTVYHGSCSVEHASRGSASSGGGWNACGQHARGENRGHHGGHSHAAGN